MKVILLALALVGSCWANDAPAQTYIAGGREGYVTQLPYVVSLNRYATINWLHYCGASIVAERWVITAAHCTQDSNVSRYRIQAGLNTQSEVSTYMQRIAVAEFVNHPSYNQASGANDISLVRLAARLVWTNAVQPITLPSRLTIIGSQGTLSGWGASTAGGVNSYWMKSAAIPISTTASCLSALRTFDALSQLCSVSTIQACRGDEGSPLEQNGVLVGVVSGQYEACSSATLPTLYTRVPYYVSWINEQISA